MDVSFSAADLAFRAKVREFFAEELPHHLREKGRLGIMLSREEMIDWQRKLHKRGWVAPNLPKELGGPGWTETQRYLFEEESGEAYAPKLLPQGISLCAVMLMGFGTPAQKAHYIPRILNADDMWCQGYSEPQSGSDLAGLKTRAERKGDKYIVNGTKMWTSYAHYANKIFCLVRTDPAPKRKQDGISMLMIDLHQPGVTIRPIIGLDGLRYINQVFFDDAEAPVSDLIGQEGDAWKITKYVLDYERLGHTSFVRSRKLLMRLREMAQAEREDGARLIDDPSFRSKISCAAVDLDALSIGGMRALAKLRDGEDITGDASLLKTRGTETEQLLSELQSQAVAYYGQPYDRAVLEEGWNEPPIGPEYAATVNPFYFMWRKSSISGGSNEIQHNIIAKRVLGL